MLASALSTWAIWTWLFAAGDWNTIGGNAQRNGMSDELGPTTNTLLWQFDALSEEIDPVFIGGAVAVTTRVADSLDPLHGTQIVALDLHDGHLLWSTELPISFSDSSRCRISGLRDGQVYASRTRNGNAEYLYALNASDGSIVWQSDDLVTENVVESSSFAPDGDVLVIGSGSNPPLLRIERASGDTVWDSPPLFRGGYRCAAIDPAGTRAYMRLVQFQATTERVAALDMTDGSLLYVSERLGNGAGTQMPHFVGPDGAVYALHGVGGGQEKLVALQDTGSALEKLWRARHDHSTFASFGVAPDGAVCAYFPVNEVMRIDAATGTVQSMSESFGMSALGYFPRMAVDAAGRIYLSNGGWLDGRLYCYAPDLTVLWSKGIRGTTFGGPALGDDGILVVPGAVGVFAFDD